LISARRFWSRADFGGFCKSLVLKFGFWRARISDRSFPGGVELLPLWPREIPAAIGKAVKMESETRILARSLA